MDLKFDFYLFCFFHIGLLLTIINYERSPPHRPLSNIPQKKKKKKRKERKKQTNSKDLISCQVNLLCSMFFIRSMNTLVNFVLLILKELKFPQNCILNFLYLSMRSLIVTLVKQITKHCFTVIYDAI